MADEDFDGGGSTGYGGSTYANSESGINSSSRVKASAAESFSNTGAPGSTYIPDKPTTTGVQSIESLTRGSDRAEFDNWYQANYANKPSSPSSMMPGGGGGGGSALGSYSPAYSPGASNPNMDVAPEKPEEQKESGGGGGGGGGGPVSKSRAPVDPWADMHKVQPNPLPFQPVIPIPGSGQKRAFFQAQEDLLKAMYPYYNDQLKAYSSGGR